MNWHLLPLSKKYPLLDTSPSGIEQTNASKRLSEYGKIKLLMQKRSLPYECCFEQLTNFMILILIAVANYIRIYRRNIRLSF
jgi:Ca2+-transporting ATPase